MVTNALKKKINYLRYNYGQPEADYFLNNPVCEECLEDRLVLLAIHHVHGKNIDKFKTVCLNCHMLEHTPKSKHHTYKSCMQEQSAKLDKMETKKALVLRLLDQGVSLRNIIGIANTSMHIINQVMKANRFIAYERQGYKKISNIDSEVVQG